MVFRACKSTPAAAAAAALGVGAVACGDATGAAVQCLIEKISTTAECLAVVSVGFSAATGISIVVFLPGAAGGGPSAAAAAALAAAHRGAAAIATVADSLAAVPAAVAAAPISCVSAVAVKKRLFTCR